jgi:hypothetical protein
MAESQDQFRVEVGKQGGEVRPIGVIDEHADLSFLARLREPTTISLAGVRRINSFGVRAWIESLRQVRPGVRLRFVECPPPLIDQINMVGGFLGGHELVSFYIPLACEKCGATRDDLVTVAECKALGGKLPAAKCTRCGGVMEVDDVEDQYLLFLREG